MSNRGGFLFLLVEGPALGLYPISRLVYMGLRRRPSPVKFLLKIQRTDMDEEVQSTHRHMAKIWIMEVLLPRTIGTADLASLYAVCGAVLRTDDAEIVFNAHQVEFIDPHGLAVLCALLSPLSSRSLVMRWLSTPLAGYMDRMDFFKHCELQEVYVPDWNRIDHPERLVELTCITDINIDNVANRLADAITGRLTAADPNETPNQVTGRNEYESYRYPLWYSLSELLENAVTHARQHGRFDANVWVACQFYEGNGQVKMSVVDNGCGILRSLAHHPQLKDKTHLAAIRTALEPKVSCNRDVMYYGGERANQGIGLTTTMRIANKARGRLHIATGTAQLETRDFRGGKMQRNGTWAGTAVAFSCQRLALPSVNVRNLLPVEKGGPEVQFVD